jgi:hypothetical protein
MAKFNSLLSISLTGRGRARVLNVFLEKSSKLNFGHRGCGECRGLGRRGGGQRQGGRTWVVWKSVLSTEAGRTDLGGLEEHSEDSIILSIILSLKSIFSTQ